MCVLFYWFELGREEGKYRVKSWKGMRDYYLYRWVRILTIRRWGNQNEFGMEENYPRYTALAKRVAERESVKKALEVEGIEAFGKTPGR
jgi:hypothetical protein